jgi:hypothetical protein
VGCHKPKKIGGWLEPYPSMVIVGMVSYWLYMALPYYHYISLHRFATVLFNFIKGI